MTSPAVRVHLEIRDGFDDPLAVIEAIVDSSEAIESALREWVTRRPGEGPHLAGDRTRPARHAAVGVGALP